MKKILVLEDEANIRSFVVINLRRSGFEPIEAENGEMALEKLKVNPDICLALLDVISLGKAQAINLGVDYDRCIRRLLIGVTLCIAVATAMVGPISFLGLIMANLARQLLKTYRHSQLILGSTLFGMAILIGGELIVERVYHYAIPISVFIGVFGGLYFLYLLLTNKRV